jgi:hypothetical protein
MSLQRRCSGPSYLTPLAPQVSGSTDLLKPPMGRGKLGKRRQCPWPCRLFGAIDIDDKPVMTQTIPQAAWWKGLSSSSHEILLKKHSQCLDLIFLCGVFQVTLSPPGVFLPWFSVPRRTARALPLNEWVSRRCRAFTLPHLPSCVALTIRAWSRRTWRWTADQSMARQFTSLWEAAPANVFAVICFASLLCLPSFLVTKDQTEVGSLSRGMILFCYAIPIRSITERPSLFPFSFARNPIGRPCG